MTRPDECPRAGSRQETHDRFYHEHGPCCAGCDWWRSINSLVGSCMQSAMVSGEQRALALGISSCSMQVPPGHIPTRCDYVCGLFEDNFDWSSLPLAYQKRCGRTVERGGER